MVKFLIERFGMQKFMAAYRLLGTGEAKESGEAAAQVFQQVFGVGRQEWEAAWLETVRQSNVEPVPEARISEIRKRLQ